ncbi:MAG: malonyl-ACP O-methyltransferase BioC [Methylobacter sp.]|nr:malonyl-ACP O-methyltransferase BioC [Methylobacter sp.]MDP2427509.1 malonyl-ACP O-methyltransferase BioC [Methylobacter sp.]MDP3056794.1 malonyl-ACP O-methyltransferase BioC [Methylobacter sp.]MDP3364013.1 malonyl-ACP O-methyltransferase BioC [Methylobacter sp.]MDZ4220876.1 malonyl-ACP O-methyltransferase BioC [Methylobacter sp.]
MHLDKAKIRQSFAAASVTYDGVAALQRSVGSALLAMIDSENMGGTLLDVGCGTGFLTANLVGRLERGTQSLACTTLIALDIALPMLQVTRAKLADRPNVSYVCADAEQLPLAGQSVDGVCSNLALQWCVNLETVFSGMKRVLKPGGRLVFSTFGPQTLQELKAAWVEVDDFNHVNEFYGEAQLRHFLQQAGYAEITIETSIYRPCYASVLALMKELKHIGAHNVMAGRNKNMTGKTQMRQMMAAYERHRDGGFIPATFEVIIVRAS